MIIADRLTKHYGAHAAVEDVSFRINEGEVVGLLGLNGAGKTTTLRILSGVLLPTSGRVEIAGLDMAEHPEEVRARIGFLPEIPPLYGEMSVRGFLAFVLGIKGHRGQSEQTIAAALEATALTDHADDTINTLSYGYRKRVGIAQAIVHEPSLILLDEPTGGLDPVQVVHMRDLVRNLGKKHTVVVSSHILSEIHQVCDRILMLQRGQIVAEGTERELGARLGQHSTVEVEVRGSQSVLERALGAIGGAKSTSIESLGDEIVRARVELSEDKREQLASHIVGAGLGLRKLERVQVELESIFLELAGNDSTNPSIRKESQP